MAGKARWGGGSFAIAMIFTASFPQIAAALDENSALGVWSTASSEEKRVFATVISKAISNHRPDLTPDFFLRCLDEVSKEPSASHIALIKVAAGCILMDPHKY